jgi:drug/metabolite transporter (DMT)-like permease
MTLTSIILLVIAAALHALWNFVSKREHPSAGFMLVAHTLGCLILTPVVALHWQAYARFPAGVWTLVVATGLCMGIYYAALAAAYRAGDMSVAYPLARSTPVILVAAVTVLLGRGGQVAARSLAGMGLVFAGCLLVPLRRFGELQPRSYVNRANALALLAAIGIAGYSMIDDEALRWLRSDPAIEIGVVEVTILYGFAEALSASFFLLPFVALSRAGRAGFREVLRTKKKSATLAGVGIYVTYTIVLVSMAFVKNVSYVIAFRQLSIPFGALLGVLALGEPFHAPKAAGVLTLFAGLVLTGSG